MATSAQTFRAHVGERTFDLTLDGDQLLLDGNPVDYSFTPVAEGYYALTLEGQSTSVLVEPSDGGRFRVTLEGRRTDVRVQDAKALLLERFGLDDAGSGADREVRAPMPGLVLRVNVEPGQAVQQGDSLLVLEAMKMENELRAPIDATVAAVHVGSGDAVGKNAVLVEFAA